MIKFFRKIRQKMLTENKFSKYLIYAIGEILLVIIGILIALWINNQNQDRVKEEKIKSTLIAIQNDIIQDTYYSEWLVNRFIKNDSLYAKILDNRMNYDQLNGQELLEIRWMSSNTTIYKIQTNGYAQLMNSQYELSQKYNPLLRKLNRLYKTQLALIERRNDETIEIVSNYTDYRKYNEHWQADDVYKGIVSDAQKAFYRDNPVFKNHVAHFHWSLNHMMSSHSRYRQIAMETYVMINEFLGKNETELPTEIRVSSVNTMADANKLEGIYVLTSGPDNTKLGEKLEIRSEGKDLFISYDGQEEPQKLLFCHHEKPWFTVVHSSILMRFEAQGKNTMSINDGERPQTHWKKYSIDEN